MLMIFMFLPIFWQNKEDFPDSSGDTDKEDSDMDSDFDEDEDPDKIEVPGKIYYNIVATHNLLNINVLLKEEALICKLLLHMQIKHHLK